MSKLFTVGIDIGGTNTTIGLVSPDGKVLVRKNLVTTDYKEFQTYVADIVKTIKELITLAKIDGITSINDLAGIGIGAPNANHKTGCMENPPNLPQFPGVSNFVDEFKKNGVAIEIAIDNDANASAYGETVYGNAKGIQHFMTVTLGTGVGSGIFAGELLYGSTGTAGELGHITLHPNGRKCSCGRKGCLEEYCSARGVEKTHRYLCRNNGINIDENARKYAQIAGEKPDGKIHCHHIGMAAQAGDSLAIETFRRVGEDLGLGLASVAAITAPEVIFLMGGPTKVGEPLLTPLRASFEQNLLFSLKGKCKILMSELNDNDSAILGASALAIAQLTKKNIT
jgi:glucokinase